MLKIRFNKVYNPIYFILLINILFSSCLTPEETKRYNLNFANKTHDVLKNDPILENLAEETRKANNKVFSTSDTFETNLRNVNEFNLSATKAIDLNFEGEARDDLKSWLGEIYEANAEIEDELLDIKSSHEEISRILHPSYINAFSEQLIQDGIEKFNKEHGAKKLKSKDKNRILKYAKDQVEKLINTQSQATLKNNEKFRPLLTKLNSIAFEIKTIEANIILNKYLWRINSLIKFDTGDMFPSDASKRIIEEDFNLFLDSLIFRILSITSEFNCDTCNYTILLNTYTYGYADSQKFSNISRSKELNQILSENRADETMKIALIVFHRKNIAQYFKNILFSHPIITSNGYGEAYPCDSIKFKSEGKPDLNRRITLLHCIFRLNH